MASTESNELMEAALSYAKKGWRVLPLHWIVDGACSCKSQKSCTRPGKHPWFKEWQKKATTDAQQIRDWWTKYPQANVGITTGVESGIIAFDVDAKTDGPTTWAELVKMHGKPPEGPTVKTGGGGFHYYFRHSGGKVGTRANVAAGIDIRGDGGLVVAPPSKHVSGRKYEWITAPEVAELPQAPEWMLELAASVSKKEATPAADVAVTVASNSIVEGTRNQTLFDLGRALRDQGRIEESVRSELHDINTKRCKPPLDESEVNDIVASVMKYQKGGGSQPAVADDVASRILGGFIGLDKLYKKPIQRPPCLLGDGLLYAGESGVLFGPPEVGKSWLALQLADAVAHGKPFLGLTTTKTRVLYLSLERPDWVVKERMESMGVGPTNAIGLLSDDAHRGWLNIEDPKQVDALIDLSNKEGIGLIIIDPLSRLHQKEENSSKEMSVVFAALQRIRSETGAAIVYVHHTKKPGKGDHGVTMLSLRGTSMMAADVTLGMALYEKGGRHVLDFRKVSLGRQHKPIYVQQVENGSFEVTIAPPTNEEVAIVSKQKLRKVLAEAEGELSKAEIARRSELDKKTVDKHLEDVADRDPATMKWKLKPLPMSDAA